MEFMTNLVRLAVSVQLTLLRALARHVSPGDRSYLARTLMADRFDPRTTALADLFDKGLMAWKNKQYAVEINGEEALLGRLKPFGPKILLDVGANIGEWALAAHRQLPGVAVHSFEIAPPTAAILTQNVTEAGANVVVNDFGLGATDGAITLYFTPDYTLGASTVRDAVAMTAADLGISEIQEIAARIITGDEYLRTANIDHVDLLKIDVEGAEESGFKGFKDAFARSAIDLVQFEYGPLNLSTRYLLADADRYFTERGFIMGKLYPEGIAFKTFEFVDEDLVGPNYVACRADRPDLIAALRCPVPKAAS